MSDSSLENFDNSKGRPSGADFFKEKNPFHHFEREFKKAEGLIHKDPNAMALTTISKDAFPSSRMVLFKGLIRNGFSFFTNYNSRKSSDLVANPKASLLFFWAPLEQQIRIEGEVHRLTREESEAYFRSRPRLSQIGAWASQQSEIIPDLESLQKQVDQLEKKFEGQDIPCPPNWGGWHVLPMRMEFWFGRRGRLHERYVYHRSSVQSLDWKTEILSP